MIESVITFHRENGVNLWGERGGVTDQSTQLQQTQVTGYLE